MLKAFTALVFGQVMKLVNLLASVLAIITVPKKGNSMIKITDTKEYTEKILNGSGLHIVRFCTEWSGPCQMMAPIYLEMYNGYKEVASFYKIDIDEAPLLKKEFGIVELPSILFYKNGNIIDHAVGMISRDVLIEKIEKLLN